MNKNNEHIDLHLYLFVALQNTSLPHTFKVMVFDLKKLLFAINTNTDTF